MTWQRVRSEEQIEYRIKEIVEATTRLYETNRFEEITFAMIAKEADFTRSNLYIYFKTKEEIFLELIIHDISAWRSDIVTGFTGKIESTLDFSSGWVNLYLRHERMIKMLTILTTMIEPNCSVEALAEFKKKLYGEITEIVIHLTRVLPFRNEHAITEFVYAQNALVNGMYPILNLTSKQKEAMELIGREYDYNGYKTILTNFIDSILRGLADRDS